jgi:YbbR domain-containing protein
MEKGKLLPKVPQRVRKFSEKKFRERFTVFSVCILIAAFLWLVIKLSGTYVSEVDYPIEFHNRTTDKVLAAYSDSVLELQVSAKGFRLLNLKWFGVDGDLIVDVDHMQMNKLENKSGYNYYMLTEDLKSTIASRINDVNRVVSVGPDTLYFWMDEKGKKQVEIAPRLDISYEAQYQSYGKPEIEPDTIQISGPKKLIDTINVIYTETFVAKDVDEDISAVMKLIVPEKVKAEHDKVQMNLDVEEFTEATVEIPVETVNVQATGRRIKTFPDRVKVTFWVALKDYQKVSSAQFTACVDCEELKLDENDKARVSITRFPSYVKNLRVSPRYVEYVIQNDQ